MRLITTFFFALTIGILVLCFDSTWADEPRATLRAAESEDGLLISEADAKILFYQRTTKSQNGRFARANYVHPLYDLDGNVLTEDFPDDHPHHRGIFWTWHQVWVGERKIGDPWVASEFIWDVCDMQTETPNAQSIALHARVLWKSPLWTDNAGQLKPLVDEKTTIRVHRAEQDKRKIDFEISLRAMEENVRIGGSDDEKGYGGFSTRIRLPDNIRFRGRDGEVKPQVLSVEAGPWLDMTGHYGNDDSLSGIAILCHSSLPDFPQRWILRQSRSMQNPVYPGRHAVPLSGDKPLVLRYRLVLHRGEPAADVIDGWQKEYALPTNVK